MSPRTSSTTNHFSDENELPSALSSTIVEQSDGTTISNLNREALPPASEAASASSSMIRERSTSTTSDDEDEDMAIVKKEIGEALQRIERLIMDLNSLQIHVQGMEVQVDYMKEMYKLERRFRLGCLSLLSPNS
jgi:hypothetical protein